MWFQTMDSPSLRWKTAAGFLMVIFFTSGTSALVCYQLISFQQFDSRGELLTEIYSPGENVTCSSENPACIDAQLELSIASHTVLVRYRGCKDPKDPNDERESTTSGDEYFAIRYNVSYCSNDLCNVRTASAAAPDMSTWATEASKPSNSSQCYSGLIFHEHETTLESMTCHRDSDQCYQGIGNISAGYLTSLLYIRSCHSTCTIPQRQVFGPIEFSIQEGACCSGNYCNKKEDTDRAQNNHTWEAPNGSDDADDAVTHTTSVIDTGTGDGSPSESDYDDDSDGGDSIEGTAFPTLHPRGKGPISGTGVILPLNPLLIILGITLLGLWW